LWDVCSDQEAVDAIRHLQNPQTAAETLVNHALSQFSSDNLTCMVIRFNKKKMRNIQEHHMIPVGMSGVRRHGSAAEDSVRVARSLGVDIPPGLLPPSSGEVTPSVADADVPGPGSSTGPSGLSQNRESSAGSAAAENEGEAKEGSEQKPRTQRVTSMLEGLDVSGKKRSSGEGSRRKPEEPK
ncbi:Protein phosphatase 2C 1, partial [Ascosphaera atra]